MKNYTTEVLLFKRSVTLRGNVINAKMWKEKSISYLCDEVWLQKDTIEFVDYTCKSKCDDSADTSLSAFLCPGCAVEF